MKREDFLQEYNSVKDSLTREGDNRYAYLEGTLVSYETHHDFSLVYKDDSITLHAPALGENEDCFDIELDGNPADYLSGLSPDSLIVCFYRANTVTTQFDFYENEVIRGCGDWLRSKLTEYYITDSRGVARLLHIDDWVETD